MTRSTLENGYAFVSVYVIYIIFLLSVTLITVQLAQAEETFNHDKTGFILDSTHEPLKCDSCHKSGVFKGTPTLCDGCHMQGSHIASGIKPSNHVPTSGMACDTCHRSASWSMEYFEHPGIISDCQSCHDGRKAVGKSQNHPPSSDVCETCHKPGSWATTGYDHSRVDISNCAAAGCHQDDWNLQQNKRPHPQITANTNCNACHKAFDVWIGAPQTMNHDVVVTECELCHVKKDDVRHNNLDPSVRCDSCHVSTAWGTVTAFDHGQVDTSNCAASGCHQDDWNLQQNKRPHPQITANTNCNACHKAFDVWTGAPQTMNHDVVASECELCHVKKDDVRHNNLDPSVRCDNCHVPTAWGTVTAFDHGQADTSNCAAAGCHQADWDLQKNKRPHPQITANTNCNACHQTFDAWTGAPQTMNHDVVGANCNTCHQSKMDARAAHEVYQPTKLCSDCHVGTVVWTGAKYDHEGAVDNCFSCHNTTLARGKSPLHGNTSNFCEDCHNTGSWVTTGFNHDSTTEPCINCHVSGGRAKTYKGHTGKLHFTSSDACETCHSAGGAWLPAFFQHSLVDTSDCTLAGCHDTDWIDSQNNRPHPHIQTGNNCDSCHKGFDAWLGAPMNHTVVPEDCELCHAKKDDARHNNLAPNVLCTTCHTTASWSAAVFDHSKVDTSNCATAGCHQSQWTGIQNVLPHPHVLSGTNCDACHQTTQWKTGATMRHTAATTVDNCATCHATGAKFVKQPQDIFHGQIKANTQCDSCHTDTNVWGKPRPVDHSFLDANNNCLACHDAGTVYDKDPKDVLHDNIILGLQCDSCHLDTIAWGKPRPVAHAMLRADDNCNACHAAGTKFSLKPQDLLHNNLAGIAQCDDCHTTTGQGGFTNWIKPLNHDALSQQAYDNCNQCHTSGVKYARRPLPPNTTHDPSNLIEPDPLCVTCHTGTTAWINRKMDHSVTRADKCGACHADRQAPATPVHQELQSGTLCNVCHTEIDWLTVKMDHTVLNNPQACDLCHSKTTDHFKGVVGVACKDCHVSQVDWKNIAYDKHSPFPNDHKTSPPTPCRGCHKNSSADQFRNNALMPDCAGCHTNYKEGPHKKDILDNKYTEAELSDCAGPCHIDGKTDAKRDDGGFHTYLNKKKLNDPGVLPP